MEPYHVWREDSMGGVGLAFGGRVLTRTGKPVPAR